MEDYKLSTSDSKNEMTRATKTDFILNRGENTEKQEKPRCSEKDKAVRSRSGQWPQFKQPREEKRSSLGGNRLAVATYTRSGPSQSTTDGAALTRSHHSLGSTDS